MKNLLRILICCLFLQGQVFGGASIDFTPSAQFINLGSASIFDNLTPMSIGAWVYAETAGGGNAGSIVYKRGTAGTTGWKFGLSTSLSGSLQFILDAGTDINFINRNKFGLGAWTFVAVTWDGTFNANNVHLYTSTLNYVAIQEPVYVTAQDGAAARVSDAANNLTIGSNDTANSQGWDGQIAYVKISSVVWTMDELYNVMNCADSVPRGLVGAWSLTGDYFAIDDSANGNHGTFTGSPVSSSNGPPTSICGGGNN